MLAAVGCMNKSKVSGKPAKIHNRIVIWRNLNIVIR